MSKAKDIGKVGNINSSNRQITGEIGFSPHPDLSLNVVCLFTLNMDCEFGNTAA